MPYNAKVKRSQTFATLSFLALASASFGGYFTWSAPEFVGGAVGTGTWSATISGNKAIWSYSASAVAEKTVTSATASSSVTALVRWTATWHADFPGETPPTSTDALVSVYGHASTSAKAYFRGPGPASASGEAQLTGGWLGGPLSSGASAVTSDVEVSDFDGTDTNHACSSIAFDDASGSDIPVVGNTAYVQVAIGDMVTASASISGGSANRPSAGGGGDAYGELELINVGGTSAEIILDLDEEGLSESLQALARKRESQAASSWRPVGRWTNASGPYTSTAFLSKSFDS